MRILLTSFVAALACAAPASASQVFEYSHGHLIPRQEPALPPPAGPEIAVPGGEQACPILPAPKVSAAGTSVRGAIAAARRHRTISAADAGRYRTSYSRARRAHSRVHGRNRR